MSGSSGCCPKMGRLVAARALQAPADRNRRRVRRGKIISFSRSMRTARCADEHSLCVEKTPAKGGLLRSRRCPAASFKPE